MAIYTFQHQQRLAFYRRHHSLVSQPLTTTLLVVAMLTGLAYFIYLATGWLTVGAIVSIGVGCTGLLSMIKLYGHTSLPSRPPMPVSRLTSGNLADALSYDTLSVLHALPDAHNAFTGAQILQALHQQSNHIQQLLRRLQIPADVITASRHPLTTQSLTMAELVESAFMFAQQREGHAIRPGDLLQALLARDDARLFLRQYYLQSSDIAIIMHRYHWLQDQEDDRRRWWRPERVLAFTGLGRSFTTGYTAFVDQFARLPAGNIWDVIDGHEDELEQVIIALARARQSNVLLVGNPGVGTMGIIKELRHRINSAQAHPALNGQRLLYLHLAQVATLGTSPSQQQAFIARALNEIEQAGNMIVVLDGIRSMFSQSSNSLNASDLLTPFLSSPNVRVITLVSPHSYHQTIEPQSQLLELFEVVDVPALSADDTLRLLVRTIDDWEARYDLYLPYQTLRELVTKTKHILPFVPFPEKAFDLLEDAIAHQRAHGSQQDTISVPDINYLVSQKVDASVGAISANESERLLQLPDTMHRHVVNQRPAINALHQAMIRSRAGTRNPDKPIGAFLFLGPTGVGKTQTAKALAHAYFGNQQRLQRLNMTQYQGQTGLRRLLGGSGQSGHLTALINDHPFSVLLLDEFEKADELVRQLFMPVFDEGYIADHSGRKYSFANTIIIATSNAGAEYIRQQVNDQNASTPDDFADGLREHILSTNVFTPELLNRFDDVITFTPLSRQHVQDIAKLMLQQLNQRLDAKHGITVKITSELIKYLADIGYDPDFGARPMQRAIQNTVEYAVAEQITRRLPAPGQVVTIQPDYLRHLQTSNAPARA